MSEILVDRHDAVMVITFNRPDKGNALNPALVAGLGEALDAAASDDGVAAVVLTGAGDRVFCAGLDLAAFSAGESVGGDATAGFTRFFQERYPKPLIAAANGHVVAGGFEILLRCDLVVAAEHVEFGLPEAARGLAAAAGISMLSQRIPMAMVCELGLTAQRIPVQRAYDLGLVNRIVPTGAAREGALELAGVVAANSPLSLRVTKEIAYAAEDGDHASAWERVAAAMNTVMTSADAQEGALAFVEKRPPVWTGR